MLLTRHLFNLKKVSAPLFAEKMSILMDIENCLEYFDKATTKVSSSKHVIVSLIILITFGIYNNLSNLQQELMSKKGKVFCMSFIESMKKRLLIYETRIISRIYSILDPKFQKEGFRSQENTDQAAIFLEQEINILVKMNENKTKMLKLSSISPKKSFFSFIIERNEEK